MLSESDPGNAGWQRDLVVSYFSLARLEENSANNDAANGAFTKCLTVMNLMKRNQMHFDPALENVYQLLLDRFGDRKDA